jgi:hypothetical protein
VASAPKNILTAEKIVQTPSLVVILSEDMSPVRADGHLASGCPRPVDKRRAQRPGQVIGVGQEQQVTGHLHAAVRPPEQRGQLGPGIAVAKISRADVVDADGTCYGC